MSAARDRVFLDANVLFSPAWREVSGLLRLWSCPGLVLLTSTYAAEEARRNLDTAAQQERLATLMAAVEMVPDVVAAGLPEGVTLPDKDRPVLSAAIRANATHLLTGDARHFGDLYGRAILGVREAQGGQGRKPGSGL